MKPKLNLPSLLVTLFLLIFSGYSINQILIDRELDSLDPSQILGEVAIDTPVGYYLVTQVVDGDTLKIDLDGSEETVRLLSIDTPETKDPRKPVQCFGREAAQHLTELVLNQPVRLETDSLQGDRDRYNRLLRYIYLQDGTFINAEMVSQGYAFAYTDIDSDQLEYIQSLEIQARLAGRGLWSSCDYQ